MYLEQLKDELNYFDDDDEVVSKMSDEQLEKLSNFLDDLMDLF